MRLLQHLNNHTIQCGRQLKGLGKLLNTIKIVQNRLNQKSSTLRPLPPYDTRLRLSNQVVKRLKPTFKIWFSFIIQRNVRLGEAPSFGETIIMHMPIVRSD